LGGLGKAMLRLAQRAEWAERATDSAVFLCSPRSAFL
jgi:hypothetical protein